MKKLTEPTEIKKYIRSTILTGDSYRIANVLQRYWKIADKKQQEDLIKTTKEIFKNMI